MARRSRLRHPLAAWGFDEEQFYDAKAAYYDNVLRTQNNVLENLTIYISTHQDFVQRPVENNYVIVSNQDKVENYSGNDRIIYVEGGLINKRRAYNEFVQIYHVLKNEELNDYIGFCHYHRYFDLNHVSNLDDLFKDYDVIVHRPAYESIRCLWKRMAQNDEYVETLLDIIEEKYGTSRELLNEKIDEGSYYNNAMLILPKDRMKECFDWLFTILTEFDKKYDLTDDKTIQDYLKKNITNRWYLYSKKLFGRFEGYFGEGLVGLWIKLNCNKSYEVDCISDC